MRRFVIALIIALLAVAVMVVPAYAYPPPDQDASVDVACDDPGVSDENPTVGDTVLFFGTVHYDASAYNNDDYGDSSGWHGPKYETGAYVIINASGYYIVLDPDSSVVADYSWVWSTGYIMGDTGCWLDEDVSFYGAYDWGWSVPVVLEMAGEYTAENGGDIYAEYGHWIQWYKWESHGWCGGEWVPDGDPVYYAEGDPAYDACFAQRTVTCIGGQAVLNKPHAVLTIQLPDGRGLFFGSDGWDDPTDQGISFSDGTWQVDIATGTLIELDGKWHMLTTLTVDDQGQVTFEYGKSGTTATDIGLSQPIVITKVG